jgi:hypothetical protein
MYVCNYFMFIQMYLSEGQNLLSEKIVKRGEMIRKNRFQIGFILWLAVKTFQNSMV